MKKINGPKCLKTYLQRISENTKCNGFTLKKKFLYGWLPVLMYCSLIYFLSSQKIEIKIDVPMIDKWIHFLEYGFLCLLCFHAYALNNFDKITSVATKAVMFSTLYGATDEIHQYFVPGRDSSFLDAVFNFLGSLIMALILVKFLKKFTKQPI